MTWAICLRERSAAFCVFPWVSPNASINFGTMEGRDVDNCRGAQFDIAPSNSEDAHFVRHESSSNPLNKDGNNNLTPWADSERLKK
jgi:hypothetical protein